MTTSPVAARYAQALGDLMPETGDLERAASAVRALAARVVTDPTDRLFWRSRSVGRHVKRELLMKAAAGMDAPEALTAFVEVLLDNHRVAELPEIADALDACVADRLNRARARVVSARPLSEAQQEAIRSRLAATSGKDVQLDAAVDESLIGGVRVEMENRILDGSVRGRLDALAGRFGN